MKVIVPPNKIYICKTMQLCNLIVLMHSITFPCDFCFLFLLFSFFHCLPHPPAHPPAHRFSSSNHLYRQMGIQVIRPHTTKFFKADDESRMSSSPLPVRNSVFKPMRHNVPRRDSRIEDQIPLRSCTHGNHNCMGTQHRSMIDDSV